LDTVSAGFKAAALLDNLLKGGKIPKKDCNIFVNPIRVNVRQSTDMLAVEDQDVVKVLYYIRENFNKAIQVQDVVDYISVSRRNLEMKFKNHVGCSIASEIKRVRIDHVARMLIETDMTVSQIAKALNFSCVEHISRLFRKEKGISPIKYRKQNSDLSL
jgi:LacI family transcriptional regulator